MRPLFVSAGEGAIIHLTPSHPMTTYLPGYTYLFASTARQEDAPYFIRLRKAYIRAVLQDLHDLFHHVYVLLENLPENRFAITRCHNHAGSHIRPDSSIAEDRFTLRQFREHYTCCTNRIDSAYISLPKYSITSRDLPRKRWC